MQSADNFTDRARQFIKEPDRYPLKTEADKARYSVIMDCARLLFSSEKCNTYSDVYKALVLLDDGLELSEATIYRYCKEAEQIFGEILRPNADIERHIVIQQAKANLNRALDEEKINIALVDRCINTLNKCRGIDTEPSDLPDFSAYKGTTNVLIINVAGQKRFILEDDLSQLNERAKLHLQEATVEDLDLDALLEEDEEARGTE